ncbi:unnamed protein product [Arctia plantaginis]|uniref:Uncharacterized protein n=1 Tax=Arctia plantaginis TaxID=874455 RepID=A0A8S0Z220_ARCPL|nr:unnamed protein product [Arctia plantaginis]
MESEHQPKLNPVRAFQVLHGCNPDPDESYTSLSEYHDYEPSLEFDDSELIQSSGLEPQNQLPNLDPLLHIEDSIEDIKFSNESISLALKEMKTGSAPGRDDIPAKV